MPGQSRSFGRSIDDARREFHQSEREVLLDDMEVSGKYVTFYKPDVIDMAQLLSAAQSEDNDLVRIVRILNWPLLAAQGDFDDSYLQLLGQVQAA